MAAPSGYLHPSLINLAPSLPEAALADLAHEVMEDYESDRKSRTAWEQKHRRWVELYYQENKPTVKREWKADESLPILTESVNQFHTRMYSAMFANPRLVVAKPMGRATQADRERAERVSLHMTWQLTVQDRGYKREMDRLLLAVPRSGTVFRKIWRDPWRQRNMVRNVRAIDLIMPYGVGPRALEDIPRKTELIWTTHLNTRKLADVGYLTEPAQPGVEIADHLTAPELAEQKAQGVADPGDMKEQDKPVLLLECHRWADFDGEGPKPYIVTVDPRAEKVLRVSARWETDEAGNPAGRSWYDAFAPEEYFVQWNFLENPDGTYGLGMGHILGNLNLACNRIMREILDAGALATVGNLSGLVNKTMVGVGGGDLEIKMGKFTAVDGTTDDIRKGIFPFSFTGPNEALYKTLELLLNRSDRLGLNTEAVTGQLDRALQPTTVLALLEQSNQSFGSVNERMIETWGIELSRLYALNARHLDPMEYFSVLDAVGTQKELEIGRTDYEIDAQIMPTVDPKQITDKERQARAQLIYQTLIQEPLTNIQPVFRYNVIKQFLQAMRAEDIETLVANPVLLPVQLQAVLLQQLQSFGTDETGLPDGSGSGAGTTGMAGEAGGANPAGGDAAGVPPGGAAPGTPGGGLRGGATGAGDSASGGMGG